MIKVKIKKSQNKITYFKVSGHANMGNYGEDIVCAAVSSVTQMTLNGLLEVLKLNNLKYEIKDGLIICDLENVKLKDENLEKASVLIDSMFSYLDEIAKNYPKNVKIIIEEV